MLQPSPTSVQDLLERRIMVAPTAGGPTTTDLVIAAARAGLAPFGEPSGSVCR